MSDEEARARATGWTPKEEFRGDPDRWVDAEKWNKRADELMPILKANNKKLVEDLESANSKLGATESEVSELKKTLKRMADASAKVSEREYSRALETIRKEQAQAISEGDAGRWEELEKQKDSLEKPEKIDISETPIEDPGKAQREFMERNPWYDAPGKEAMTGYAYKKASELQANGITDPAKQLKMVEDAVKQAFPDEFNNKRRQTQAVEGDSSKPEKKSSGKKGYDDLPAEAKTACDNFVKTIKGYTKEQYVKEYFSEEE